MTRQTALKLWLCAVLLILSVFLSMNVLRSITELGAAGGETGEPEAAPAAAVGSIDGSRGYVLREYEGCIGVFSPEGGAPITLTDIETATMRRGDRDMLQAGITVDSYEGLLMLLEDFGS